jgi:hypothetical protein
MDGGAAREDDPSEAVRSSEIETLLSVVPPQLKVTDEALPYCIGCERAARSRHAVVLGCHCWTAEARRSECARAHALRGRPPADARQDGPPFHRRAVAGYQPLARLFRW